MAGASERWTLDGVDVHVDRADNGWRALVGGVWAGSVLAVMGLFTAGFALASHVEYALILLGSVLLPITNVGLVLVGVAVWFATRPVRIRVGRRGIGVGHHWFERRELVGVDLREGVIRIVPRRRPVFYSPQLAPAHPARLLELLREAVDTPEDLADEALREFVMAQHALRMRDWGRVRNLSAPGEAEARPEEPPRPR